MSEEQVTKPGSAESIKLLEAQLPERIGKLLTALKWEVTVAESCTAGGIGYAITSVSGSSAWFSQGFIVYSNAAKSRLIRVDTSILRTHGAVSEPVVQAMADGAAARAGAEVGISVSGIAGPGGGTQDKPVGTVCFGWRLPSSTSSVTMHFEGDRESVRRQSIVYSLKQLELLLLAEVDD